MMNGRFRLNPGAVGSVGARSGVAQESGLPGSRWSSSDWPTVLPSDRLAKALTMLGRVLKTIYILKYFNEEDLRHRVQLQLNRGEHRHGLARWISFADQGEFHFTRAIEGDNLS